MTSTLAGGLALSAVLAISAQERARPIVVPATSIVRPLGLPVRGLPPNSRITKIDIITRESPTFGGYSWPGVGQYEKLVGKAFGQVDPTDPKNAVIVDLLLAPQNARGYVEYSFDFYILKPIDLTKGAHKVMYEPPNRGRKTWASLGRVTSGGNDPGSITNVTELASAFLMPRGYTLVWSGWDASAGNDNAGFVTTMAFPIAKNRDGSSITGPAYEYIVSPGSSYTLNYPAATLNQADATLTHRVKLNDPPQVITLDGWKYNATGTAIALLPVGTPFVANDIYEFSYTAKDPTVNGLGFAAVRDWNAFLKFDKQDDAGHANPLAGDVTRIYTEISSQPGRLLNDFVNLGFNQAENGQKVFDGMLQWIAAGDGLNMNYRFSQPGRTERNRQDHLYLEGRFPFANVSATDALTGKTASRYDKCTITDTCPLAVEIYSANEYWVKAGSLLHTDPAGTTDLPDSPFTRNYFIASHQHGTGNASTKGSCQQLQNPLDSAPVQRALFTALDEWSTLGIQPPGPCHYPLAGWSEFARLMQSLIERDFYGNVPTASITAPNLKRAFYTNNKKDSIALEFTQPVAWTDSLAGQFYLDGVGNKVATGAVSGNVVTLKLKEASAAKKIAYLSELHWSQNTLIVGANGVAALTFCDVPIATTKSVAR